MPAALNFNKRTFQTKLCQNKFTQQGQQEQQRIQNLPMLVEQIDPVENNMHSLGARE